MKGFRYIGTVGFLIVLISAFSLVPSCRHKPSISDQIIVTAIGIEGKEMQYTLSVQAVDALKTSGSLSEQSQNATAVYRASGASVAQGLQAFLNETGRGTYILQNQLIVLRDTTCREVPLFGSLDYFIRNLQGRTLVNVAVCRESPGELLSIESGNDAIPAEYVSQLLRQGHDCGIAVQTRLLDIERAKGGSYDTVMPILGVHEKTPFLDGTAVFKDGIMVGELSVSQTRGLLFAGNDMKECLYTVEGITFCVDHCSTALTVQRGDQLRFRFVINGEAHITETKIGEKPKEAEEQELLRRVKRLIGRDTEDALLKCISEYGSDPLALSRQAAKAFSDLSYTQEQAEKELKDAEYEVEVELNLTQNGF